VFAGGTPFLLEAPGLLSVADGLAFRLDALGAFFLALVGLVAIPCGIYGAGYSAAYEGRYSLRFLGAMLNLFLLAMSLVPCAGNVLTFLLMWEGMSLTSYFLVMTETDEPDTVLAGGWYLAMTHGGLALVLAAFLLLAAGASTTAFGDLRTAAAALSPATRNAVFCLALSGSGPRRDHPAHVWLPRAHPAAPSHVSALMSGVMIKLGVYGLLRVGLDLLGGGPAWWGALLIGLGALSAVLGVLYALMENDLKRLLAYSSVENIGLIFIGVGAGFLFLSLGAVSAAVLALVAGLYHALNHAAFKGLLFLGAGSVLHAAHTRDMNRLGGLIRRLPWTALCFLTGSLAIAGLPPLNGFVSEWLLFQSLLPGIGSSAPLVAPLMTLAVGILALTGGLAATGFVKAFGITFLAMPRSDAAEAAHEAPRSMRVGMGILAVACAGLGLAAVPILAALGAVLAGHAGSAAAPRWVAAFCSPRPGGSRGCRRRSWPSGSPSSSPACGWGSGSSGRADGSAWVRRGDAAVGSRRRGWSTRRPRSPSPCAACSPSCTARPRTSRSTSIRSRDTSCSRSSTGARSSPGSSAISTRRSSPASGAGASTPGRSSPARPTPTSPTS
jgi:hydrogenase-4 component B